MQKKMPSHVHPRLILDPYFHRFILFKKNFLTFSFFFFKTQSTKEDQTVTQIIAPINLSHKREEKTQNLSTESLLKSTGDLSNKTFPIKKLFSVVKSFEQLYCYCFSICFDTCFFCNSATVSTTVSITVSATVSITVSATVSETVKITASITIQQLFQRNRFSPKCK